jgi:tellurite resistance protein
VAVDSGDTTAPMTTSGADAAVPETNTVDGRDRWLRLYPIALGMGGLGGSWRTAVALGAPAWPAICLAVLCLGAWVTVTAMYVVKGGARPRGLLTDLRHPEQGFALGYIPIIPLVLLANAVPRTAAFRILDLGLAVAWAVGTAALVAHWITTPRDRHAIHPGFSLPVVGGPFIACISLQANGWHSAATGVFFVGAYFWLTFGAVIVGRLMTEQRLSDARFPTLATLMVPPATASTAWFALNGNRSTTVGVGLAAVLAMMALVQLFILPEYVRHPFSISCWSFSFPLGSAANAVGHWAIAAPGPANWWLAWSTLIVATSVVGLLVLLTVRMAWRQRITTARGVLRWRGLRSRPPNAGFVRHSKTPDLALTGGERNG